MENKLRIEKYICLFIYTNRWTRRTLNARWMSARDAEQSGNDRTRGRRWREIRIRYECQRFIQKYI